MKRSLLGVLTMSVALAAVGPLQDARATHSGENGKIAFASYSATTGRPTIYLVDGSGGDAVAVPDIEADVPHWTADGRYFIVDGWTPSSDIFLLDEKGSLVRDITAAPKWQMWSTISPDGKRIAYIGQHRRLWQIYVQRTFGRREPRKITNLQEFPWRLDWSPDGKRIAFLNPTKGGVNEIFTVRPDGTGLRRVTHGAYAHNVSWSPDGLKLLYTSYRKVTWEPNYTLCIENPTYAFCDYDLYTIHPDGTNETRLTSGPATDWAPSWSPDGKWIVFSSNRLVSEEFDIYVMNANGEEIRRLTGIPGQFDGDPAWQPLPKEGLSR